MKKYFYLVFLLMSSLAVQAQRKDTKANKQKETVLEEIQVVEEETIEVEEVEETVIGSSNNKSGVIYLNKKRYKTRGIGNNCAIYYKESDNNFGIIKNGKRLLPNIFYERYFDNKGSDKIVLKIKDKKSYTKIYGVFDLVNEKWVLPLAYESIKKLTGNYYAVQKDDYYAIHNLENKKIIANEKWKSIDKFYGINSDYYYMIKGENYSYGIYNIISKKTIIPCVYKSLSYNSNLNYFKVSKDKKYNYVNVKNQFLFKNWYEHVQYKDGFFIVKKDGKMGVIDRGEKEIVPIKYLMIQDYRWGNTNSYLAQNEEKKFGFITIDGTVTFPFVYDEINTSYTFAKLKTADDKCGILVKEDDKMKIIASCKYDEINRKGDYFIVVKDGKYGLLDAKGEKVLDEKYDDISKSTLYRNELVLKKGTNYFLFSKGNISKEKYKDIKALKQGNGYSSEKYLVVKCNANKYGLMDYFEVMVTPCMFDEIIHQIKDNYLLVKMGEELGIYDVLNQKMIVAAEYESIIKNGYFFYGIKGAIIDKIYINSKVTITRL